MNHCPNYMNKILYLSEDKYPCYDIPVYKLENDRVAEVYAQGYLPEIRVKGVDIGNRSKIAIILGQDKHPDREEKDFTIHPAYVRAIIEAGGYPLFFAYDKIEKVLENYQPQGILLIGGFFNSPKDWYESDDCQDIDKRGQAYLNTLKYAQKHNLPLLGICAGMQMLGGFCGAKLEKGHKNHLIGGDKIVHKIKIKKGTLLAKIAEDDELTVNSHHSEAIVINKPGKCIISALSDDEVVEAIEPQNPWSDFVLGVQWHPERNFPNSEDFRTKLFGTFVKACSGK